MTDQRVLFYPRLKGHSAPETASSLTSPKANSQNETASRIEPATCAEAETFVLQVLDDTMEPEFRKGCVIVIDPTGRATDGSFVLARRKEERSDQSNDEDSVGDYVFRQLIRLGGQGGLGGQGENDWALAVLNPEYDSQAPVPVDLTDVIGVIVQRAGVRRRYHKRYD